MTALLKDTSINLRLPLTALPRNINYCLERLEHLAYITRSITFIQEIPRIDTLEGIERTPFNQYDSIILPLTRYLEAQGVEFKYGKLLPSLRWIFY